MVLTRPTYIKIIKLFKELKFSSFNKLFSKRNYIHFSFQTPLINRTQFVLILASDRTVLYRSVAYSILLLSIKMKYPSFLKKFSLLEKSCFKAKALKKFKISSDCHLKPSRFLKKVAILKSPVATVFFLLVLR